MLVRITPEAEADLTEAREWYSHQRADLDLEFMQSVDDALSLIVNSPNSFSGGLQDDATCRRSPLPVRYILRSHSR